MKVAYNDCFGGFSLSPLAETEYRKKKGLNLTWYKGEGEYPYRSYVKISDITNVEHMRVSAFSYTASNADLGDKVAKIPEENYFYESWYGRENRADPDLIEVIERLGKAANGEYANLAIAEIPDGARFEITEYDGNEEVVPPRMSW